MQLDGKYYDITEMYCRYLFFCCWTFQKQSPDIPLKGKMFFKKPVIYLDSQSIASKSKNITNQSWLQKKKKNQFWQLFWKLLLVWIITYSRLLNSSLPIKNVFKVQKIYNANNIFFVHYDVIHL